MQIILCSNISDNCVIGKEITTLATLSDCRLLEGCSKLHPSLIVTLDNTSIGANYCHIPFFNRYYYIDEAIILDENRIQFNCTVDVLESFKSEILALDVTVSRQTNDYNKYLMDNSFYTECRHQLQSKVFAAEPFNPSGISTIDWCYVITVANGGGN